MIDWKQSLWVEHQVAQIISDQSKHGVAFDVQKARFYIHILTEKILAIDREVIPQMPLMMVKGSVFSKPFLKNGQLTTHVKEYITEHADDVFASQIRGPFSRVWFEPFDMGKTGLVKEYLLTHGWEPDTWNWKTRDLTQLDDYVEDMISSPSLNCKLEALNFTGARNVARLKDVLRSARKWPTSPKLTETSFKSIGGSIPSLVKQRLTWSHRRSLIQGLLDNVRPDGKLSAKAISCATPTGRMRHSIVVNIPASKSEFGEECRSLFTGDPDPTVKIGKIIRLQIPDGSEIIPHTNRYRTKKKDKWFVDGYVRRYIHDQAWPMVGYDGAGLELRMLAHYINDPSFTDALLNGDPHTRNQLAAGLPTRDDAKTFIYAFIYGAGDAKLGSIVGGGSQAGELMREKFLKANPLLDVLIKNVQSQAEKGFLIGLDGRKLTLRRGENGKVLVHKALNTLLQGAGAIVMKYAMVILDHWVKQSNLRAYKVLDIHDEGQWTCHPDDVDQLAKYMGLCVKTAGEYLNMNIALASDAKIGSNWSHTH